MAPPVPPLYEVTTGTATLDEPMDDADDSDDPADAARARDVVRQGALPPRRTPGEATCARLVARVGRRPVGDAARLWRRVAGDEPLADDPLADDRSTPTRRTVYAEARLDRLEPASEGRSPAAEAPSRGEPTGNLGEALIPPGFRDLPIARTAPSPPPTPPQRPPPRPALPEPARTSPTGRFRTLPRRGAASVPSPPDPITAPTADDVSGEGAARPGRPSDPER